MKCFLASVVAVAVLLVACDAANCTGPQTIAHASCYMQAGLLGGTKETCEAVGTGDDACTWCDLGNDLLNVCTLRATCTQSDGNTTECPAAQFSDCQLGSTNCLLEGGESQPACEAKPKCKWCGDFCFYAPATACTFTSPGEDPVTLGGGGTDGGQCPSGVSMVTPTVWLGALLCFVATRLSSV